ncbi:MAG: PatB family C-S lyase [Muribaculaceae bacterium]|nr:PatB family C-S lyase [Muribaculaceae bacterium]MDE7188960.1 PatB family C-S lyase [Muribaculaceae bacterium]
MTRKYDFDTEIERRGSGALKTDALGERYGRPDLIPLWVADMDFATPDFIIDALRRRLDHPVLGYTIEPADYRPAIIDWVRRRHGWELKPEWLTYIPGIVKGIAMVMNVFTKPGDKVIVQPPVYHPFSIVSRLNGREVVENPLVKLPDGGYAMDLEHLEKIAPGCKLLILSNPHNPAGIVWDTETLRRLADICKRNGIVVISDEIHSDMTLFGHKHVPFATVSPEAESISITFGAPSKTFNIAGVVSSYAVVSDPELRSRFYNWLEANELSAPDIFAPIATIAAYRKGEEWRVQMLEYIEDNIRYVEDYCSRYIPEIKPLRPQASFLVWMDCRELGLDHDGLNALFVDKAGLALNDGEMFGHGGEGYMRLNVGCPRATLTKALDSLRDAVKEYRQQSADGKK